MDMKRRKKYRISMSQSQTSIFDRGKIGDRNQGALPRSKSTSATYTSREASFRRKRERSNISDARSKEERQTGAQITSCRNGVTKIFPSSYSVNNKTLPSSTNLYDNSQYNNWTKFVNEDNCNESHMQNVSERDLKGASSKGREHQEYYSLSTQRQSNLDFERQTRTVDPTGIARYCLQNSSTEDLSSRKYYSNRLWNTPSENCFNPGPLDWTDNACCSLQNSMTSDLQNRECCSNRFRSVREISSPGNLFNLSYREQNISNSRHLRDFSDRWDRAPRYQFGHHYPYYSMANDANSTTFAESLDKQQRKYTEVWPMPTQKTYVSEVTLNKSNWNPKTSSETVSYTTNPSTNHYPKTYPRTIDLGYTLNKYQSYLGRDVDYKLHDKQRLRGETPDLDRNFSHVTTHPASASTSRLEGSRSAFSRATDVGNINHTSNIVHTMPGLDPVTTSVGETSVDTGNSSATWNGMRKVYAETQIDPTASKPGSSAAGDSLKASGSRSQARDYRFKSASQILSEAGQSQSTLHLSNLNSYTDTRYRPIPRTQLHLVGNESTGTDLAATSDQRLEKKEKNPSRFTCVSSSSSSECLPSRKSWHRRCRGVDRRSLSAENYFLRTAFSAGVEARLSQASGKPGERDQLDAKKPTVVAPGSGCWVSQWSDCDRRIQRFKIHRKEEFQWMDNLGSCYRAYRWTRKQEVGGSRDHSTNIDWEKVADRSSNITKTKREKVANRSSNITRTRTDKMADRSSNITKTSTDQVADRRSRNINTDWKKLADRSSYITKSGWEKVANRRDSNTNIGRKKAAERRGRSKSTIVVDEQRLEKAKESLYGKLQAEMKVWANFLPISHLGGGCWRRYLQSRKVPETAPRSYGKKSQNKSISKTETEEHITDETDTTLKTEKEAQSTNEEENGPIRRSRENVQKRRSDVQEEITEEKEQELEDNIGKEELQTKEKEKEEQREVEEDQLETNDDTPCSRLQEEKRAREEEAQRRRDKEEQDRKEEEERLKDVLRRKQEMEAERIRREEERMVEELRRQEKMEEERIRREEERARIEEEKLRLEAERQKAKEKAAEETAAKTDERDIRRNGQKESQDGESQQEEKSDFKQAARHQESVNQNKKTEASDSRMSDAAAKAARDKQVAKADDRPPTATKPVDRNRDTRASSSAVYDAALTFFRATGMAYFAQVLLDQMETVKRRNATLKFHAPQRRGLYTVPQPYPVWIYPNDPLGLYKYILKIRGKAQGRSSSLMDKADVSNEADSNMVPDSGNYKSRSSWWPPPSTSTHSGICGPTYSPPCMSRGRFDERSRSARTPCDYQLIETRALPYDCRTQRLKTTKSRHDNKRATSHKRDVYGPAGLSVKAKSTQRCPQCKQLPVKYLPYNVRQLCPAGSRILMVEANEGIAKELQRKGLEEQLLKLCVPAHRRMKSVQTQTHVAESRRLSTQRGSLNYVYDNHYLKVGALDASARRYKHELRGKQGDWLSREQSKAPLAKDTEVPRLAAQKGPSYTLISPVSTLSPKRMQSTNVDAFKTSKPDVTIYYVNRYLKRKRKRKTKRKSKRSTELSSVLNDTLSKASTKKSRATTIRSSIKSSKSALRSNRSSKRELKICDVSETSPDPPAPALEGEPHRVNHSATSVAFKSPETESVLTGLLRRYSNGSKSSHPVGSSRMSRRSVSSRTTCCSSGVFRPFRTHANGWSPRRRYRSASPSSSRYHASPKIKSRSTPEPDLRSDTGFTKTPEPPASSEGGSNKGRKGASRKAQGSSLETEDRVGSLNTSQGVSRHSKSHWQTKDSESRRSRTLHFDSSNDFRHSRHSHYLSKVNTGQFFRQSGKMFRPIILKTDSSAASTSPLSASGHSAAGTPVIHKQRRMSSRAARESKRRSTQLRHECKGRAKSPHSVRESEKMQHILETVISKLSVKGRCDESFEIPFRAQPSCHDFDQGSSSAPDIDAAASPSCAEVHGKTRVLLQTSEVSQKSTPAPGPSQQTAVLDQNIPVEGKAYALKSSPPSACEIDGKTISREILGPKLSNLRQGISAIFGLGSASSPHPDELKPKQPPPSPKIQKEIKFPGNQPSPKMSPIAMTLTKDDTPSSKTKIYHGRETTTMSTDTKTYHGRDTSTLSYSDKTCWDGHTTTESISRPAFLHVTPTSSITSSNRRPFNPHSTLPNDRSVLHLAPAIIPTNGSPGYYSYRRYRQTMDTGPTDAFRLRSLTIGKYGGLSTSLSRYDGSSRFSPVSKYSPGKYLQPTFSSKSSRLTRTDFVATRRQAQHL